MNSLPDLDFPLTTVRETTRTAAKVAKPAKEPPDFSNFSNFSRGPSVNSGVLTGPWPEIDQARRLIDHMVEIEGRLDVRVPESLERAANRAFSRRDFDGLCRVVDQAIRAMRNVAAGKPLRVPAVCPACGAVLEPVMVAAAVACSCGEVVVGEVER